MSRNSASSVRWALFVEEEKKGLFDTRRDLRFGKSLDREEMNAVEVMAL